MKPYLNKKDRSAGITSRPAPDPQCGFSFDRVRRVRRQIGEIRMALKKRHRTTLKAETRAELLAELQRRKEERDAKS